MTALDELRHSGYLRAILHYQDGSVYFYACPHAYLAPEFQTARADFIALVRQYIAEAGPHKYRGHDSCPYEFLGARVEPHRLEWVT